MSVRALRRPAIWVLLAISAALVGCTRPGRALIPVDVTAPQALSDEIRRVKLVASCADRDRGCDIPDRTFGWTGSPQHLGLFVDRSVSGMVDVHAVGLRQDDSECATSDPGSVQVSAGATAELLVLALRSSQTGADGGSDTVADSGNKHDSAVDAGGEEAELGIDGGRDEGSDSHAPVDGPADTSSDGAADSASDTPVNPRAWRPPVMVWDDGVRSDQYSVVAADGQGNMLALWRHGWELWSGTYSAAGWLSAGAVETLGMPMRQQIAVDRNGAALATWIQTASGGSGGSAVTPGLWARRFTGNAWAYERTQLAAGSFTAHRMAMNLDGVAAVAWVTDPGVRQLSVRYFEPAWGWLAEKAVSLAGTQSVFTNATAMSATDGITVAVDGSGHAVVAWCQANNAGQAQIWVSQGTVQGWSPATAISSPLPVCSTPTIVLNASGRGVVTWRASVDTIVARVYESPMDLEGEQPVESGSAQQVYPPTAAVDDTGNITVLWAMSDDIGHVRVRASRRALVGTSRQPWTAPSWIEADSERAFTESSHFLRAAADAAGNVFASWAKTDANLPPRSDSAILVARFDAGLKTWSEATAVTVVPPEASAFGSQPGLAVAPTGTAAVTFTYGSTSEYHIWATNFR